MNYCNIKFHAIEDGIGCRTVLFVSGCRHHCKGCFQPQTWNFDYGEPYTDETESVIIDSLADKYVSGITLLGGEPFEPENQAELRGLVERIKTIYPDKDIWAYSGYTFEELVSDKSSCHTSDTMPMLNCIDVLVDGEFIESRMSKMLPFRGSDNQRIIDVQKSLQNNDIVLSEYHDRKR